MLNNCDSFNQNHITMHGIDGTYKIFKEKFTLVAFGRLDMVRCYHKLVCNYNNKSNSMSF